MANREIAKSRAYIEALAKFDVFALENFLKHWDRKNWLLFKNASYSQKKVVMCRAIIDNQKVFEYDDDLIAKAKKYLNEHPAKEMN